MIYVQQPQSTWKSGTPGNMKEISSKLKTFFGIFLGVAITDFFQSRWWFEIGLKYVWFHLGW
jgi:hypothetical protein